MSMTKQFKRSPLALAVLVLLHESPMHPYRMQRLIKDRGKDQVINVEQRASLYQTINQLLRAELITFWENAREEGFPERTLYRLTDKGHDTAVTWLREMLSTPAQEYPDFPAAVSLLPLLTPEDAIQQMATREAKLTEQIAAIDEEMQAVDLPKLFLLESDYMRAVLEAELKWVRALVADLRSGQITWNHDWMQPSVPPENKE
jgi:DNA-binding PadR family transcriptional regulator